MAAAHAFKTFLSDESGATAMEYCILMMLIALAGIVGFTAAGTAVKVPFEDAADGLNQ